MAIIRTKDVEATSRFEGVHGKPLINPDTGSGAITMGELTLAPGAYLPPHTHLIEEAFFIFEGKGLTIRNAEEIPVEAGTAILAETGVAHGFRNNSAAPLKMVFMYPAVNVKGFFPEK